MKKAKSIMLQGTSSHVGKSILCAALCRIFYQDGYRTAPFKAQNMALNSTVTPDGGEIGRAQGVQAEAAGIKPSVYMNPILMKPKQDLQAQIVVLGVPARDMSVWEYRNEFLPHARPLVQDCIHRLQAEYDLLVIEGAGSPAEVNLKDRDIVNMTTAELADSPVLLVADIDRGGVFAALVGTMELLEKHERERVKGFIINKFRGDLELLKPGLDFLTARTGVPVLGVVPYMHDHGIDEEDSVYLDENKEWGDPQAPIQIAVLQLPRISNFTDFNAFIGLPDARLRFVQPGEAIGDVDMVILPGSKNTILDLVYLKETGYDQEILELARRQKYVIGICGGYQMLGQELLDPEGSEAAVGPQSGLGLLPCITTYGPQKSCHQVEARITGSQGIWQPLQGQMIKGYEIHMGHSQVSDQQAGWMEITRRSGQEVALAEGVSDAGGRIWGTYLHGIFDNANIMLALINDLREQKGLALLEEKNLPLWQREKRYDRLAETVRNALDMEQIWTIIEGD